jgi:hypothetical protein
MKKLLLVTAAVVALVLFHKPSIFEADEARYQAHLVQVAQAAEAAKVQAAEWTKTQARLKQEKQACLAKGSPWFWDEPWEGNVNSKCAKPCDYECRRAIEFEHDFAQLALPPGDRTHFDADHPMRPPKPWKDLK